MLGRLCPLTTEILLFLFSDYFGCITKKLLGFCLIGCRFFVQSLFVLPEQSFHIVSYCNILYSKNWIGLSGRLCWTYYVVDVSSPWFNFEDPLIFQKLIIKHFVWNEKNSQMQRYFIKYIYVLISQFCVRYIFKTISNSSRNVSSRLNLRIRIRNGWLEQQIQNNTER